MKRLTLALIMLSLVALSHAQNRGYTYASLYEFASITEGFSILAQALSGSELGVALAKEGPYTLLAPTDAAFREMPSDELASLLDDPARLSEFLEGYMVPRGLLGGNPEQVHTTGHATVETLSGRMLEFRRDTNGRVTVNGSPVLSIGEIRAQNGTVVVIDRLLP